MSEGSRYLGSTEFARLAGISERWARKVMQRGELGGQPLNVVIAQGRGGSAGKVYYVHRDSLPADLRPQANGHDQPAQPALIPDYSSDAWKERLAIIGPALGHPEGSKGRARAIKEQAQLYGKSESTIRRWARLYEEGRQLNDGSRNAPVAKGIGALQRKPRADKGRKRYFVSRCWDEAMSKFDDATKQAIADKLRTHIASLWAEDAPGQGRVYDFASQWLTEATREAGLDLSEAELRRICRAPLKLIKELRKIYKPLATKRFDAKRWHDRHVPPTHRTIDREKPLFLVEVDITPADIALEVWERIDGVMKSRTVWPRLIGFLDTATGRFAVEVVFPARGKDVRREDVVRAAIKVFRAWGMPSALLVDNGKEVGIEDFVKDALQLTHWAAALDDPSLNVDVWDERASRVITSKPYNARAKTIEGVFGKFQQGWLSMLDGYAGPRRDVKKTHHVGKPPKPYRKGEEEFRAEVQTLVDGYNTTVQHGRLNGRSPNQFYAAWRENGWKPVHARPGTLEVAFAKPLDRRVHQGEIEVNKTWYQAKELVSLTGQWVEVRVPVVGDGAHVAVMVDDRFLCWAARAKEFGYLDPAGARDQARRAAELNHVYAELGKDVYRVNLMAETRKLVQAAAPAPVPDTAAVLDLGPAIEDAAQAHERLPDPKTREQQENDEERENMAAWMRWPAPKRAAGDE